MVLPDPRTLRRLEQRCGACYQHLAAATDGKIGCQACGWGFAWGGTHG